MPRDNPRRPILLLGALASILLMGGTMISAASAAFKSGAQEAEWLSHQNLIRQMHQAVLIAGTRCHAAEKAGLPLENLNPFAGAQQSMSMPESLFADDPADYVHLVNMGYRSLQRYESDALTVLAGNLFPVHGICGERLDRVDYGLFWYTSEVHPHERH